MYVSICVEVGDRIQKLLRIGIAADTRPSFLEDMYSVEGKNCHHTHLPYAGKHTFIL